MPTTTTTAPPQTVEAEIVSIGVGFLPNPIEINVGDTVVWTHVDMAPNIPHTVTSQGVAPPDDFDSGLIFEGATFQVTFDNPGTFSYFCTVHPNMQGQVIVN
ncbi:MAG: plastocyanin/azurin family copper-binding protein [Acidimicrobiia bacterium]|nr:plastocyanin/azurin family copper-binding protein [Acidimicrobiia bacterium]